MDKISVVIPVFNNQETLRETLVRIQNIHSSSFSNDDIEIIFIDDGSTDRSWEILSNLQNEFPEIVKVAKMARNFGQVYAILAGYQLSNGDAVITISADLQDPVLLMSELVREWKRGNEIIIAHRESRDDDVASSFFSKIAYGIARRANPRVPHGGFDYLLLSNRAVKLMLSFEGRHRFFQGDVLWMGLPTIFIPYRRERRPYGKSGWSFSKKSKYFIDLVIDSSYLPIRAMSGLGIFTAIAGLIYALLIIVTWFMHGTPFQGWAPLMIITLLVGGAIMTMLGVIGEYIWRIYDDIKKRPLYVIQEVKTKDVDGHER